MNQDIFAYMVDGHSSNEAKTEFIKYAVNQTLKTFNDTRNLIPFRFGISGFDDDARGLFIIPTVREWCSELYSSIPALFLYLHPTTINWFFLSLAKIELKNVERKEPPGLIGESYRKMIPQEQIVFKKNNPSSFFNAIMELDSSAEKLKRKIFDNGIKEIQKITSSDDESTRLANEFSDRLIEGLPKPL